MKILKNALAMTAMTFMLSNTLPLAAQTKPPTYEKLLKRAESKSKGMRSRIHGFERKYATLVNKYEKHFGSLPPNHYNGITTLLDQQLNEWSGANKFIQDAMAMHAAGNEDGAIKELEKACDPAQGGFDSDNNILSWNGGRIPNLIKTENLEINTRIRDAKVKK